MVHSRTGQWLTGLMAVVAMLAAFQVSAPAARKSKTNLKSKLQANEQKQKALKHQIHIKAMQAKDVTGQLSRVELQLEQAQSNLAQNKLKLLSAQDILQRTIERLDRTKKQLKRRQDLLERRVVDIYEGDDIQYVNVVLGSTNMWTFLTRAYYMQAILDSDTALIHQVQADKKQIEADERQQAQTVASIANLQVSLEDQRNQVADLADTRQQQLDQIENSKDLLESALNEMEAESNRIESEIKQFQNTPTGRLWAGRTLVGGLVMPVSGQITSPFGYRYHPILHRMRLHTGVDIAVPVGTPVHCAADGYVSKACRTATYGCEVVVVHGSNIQTMYGHNSRLCCHRGETVKKGQVIAISGKEGLSTGPHVHFEKRVNGAPVNPL